jgi:hypothetical protein
VKPATLALLASLVECEPDQGLVLDRAQRKLAAALVRQGLAWWMSAGGLKVYVASEEGRQLLRTDGGVS